MKSKFCLIKSRGLTRSIRSRFQVWKHISHTYAFIHTYAQHLTHTLIRVGTRMQTYALAAILAVMHTHANTPRHFGCHAHTYKKTPHHSQSHTYTHTLTHSLTASIAVTFSSGSFTSEVCLLIDKHTWVRTQMDLNCPVKIEEIGWRSCVCMRI